MKKRAATAENPWKVRATLVVVSDPGARLRAVVGILLVEGTRLSGSTPLSVSDGLADTVVQGGPTR